MYVPDAYKVEDKAKLFDGIKRIQVGHLVTQHKDELRTTFLPWIVSESEGEQGVLYAHAAKANPISDLPRISDNVVIIFTGEHGYVSPSWMPSKKATGGRVVPTWDYEAIQVKGNLEILKEKDTYMKLVSDVSDQNEKDRPEPWSVSDAPENYIKGKFNNIIGVKVTITGITGSHKYAQDVSKADKEGISRGLRADGEDQHAGCVAAGCPVRSSAKRETGRTLPIFALLFLVLSFALFFWAPTKDK
ncbi:transcriptional regulator [Angomonas deanei]|nr:transcriptional regulator [Angomonas deanei]EPY15009.1 transcriptional regulator [Angomonas deanei]EPY18640.1 transcriptional regulator [Angomonas deanei]|eukprot:EPY14966.1 transcriptional regulator [Angomonas deanei]